MQARRDNNVSPFPKKKERGASMDRLVCLKSFFFAERFPTDVPNAEIFSCSHMTFPLTMVMNKTGDFTCSLIGLVGPDRNFSRFRIISLVVRVARGVF